MFGTPNQQDPVIFNSSAKKNKPLGSLKAEDLKYVASLCHKCNTDTTQPCDLAWEIFSAKIRTFMRNLENGDRLRCNKIFEYDTSRQMLNIHLFFLKKFGCYINSVQLKNIDIKPFAHAIKTSTPHPLVHLSFGLTPDIPKETVMNTNMQLQDSADGSCAFAIWAYIVDNLTVHIMYAKPNEKRAGLVNSWHPSNSHNKILTMSNFYPK